MSEPSDESPRPRRRRRLLRLGAVGALVAIAGATIMSCVALPPAPGTIDGVERLDALDHDWPGLGGEVTISWDERLIPSITAESDADAAYAIGLVHAHLRLSQMELFRKVSQGRLAEMAGALAAGIDEGIRALDLDRATPEMAANLPPETRLWIERYVAGVNDYRATVRRRPADAVTLGLTLDEPWTVEDVLTFGRLASVDVHWGRWVSLLGLRDEPGYADFIARLWGFGDAGVPSFGPEERTDLSILTDLGRTGSNAVVVSKDRSATGSALMATDPHLGIPVPNLWVAIGYRTPERSAVGLTIPSLPFVLVGRNEAIGWSGTNMQASSSVLYRLEDGWEPVSVREEAIGVRFWFDRTATIRESALGPVLTDASLLAGRLGDGDIAFAWRGHLPSDEASAFLRASRAQDWEAFREAFRTYAVSGQNMLYADREGAIGQIMAIEAMPAAAAASRVAPVSASDEAFAWTPGVASPSLPAAFNPEAGFLVSANNVPVRTSDPLVPQGNSNDRVERLNELLRSSDAVTLDDLAALQLDVHSIASHRTAGAIAARLEGAGLSADARALVGAIGAWDGRYDADSTGAVAYQRALGKLIDRLYGERYGERIRGTIRSGPYVHDFVRVDLDAAPVETVAAAVEAAAPGWSREQRWGDLHRLRLRHPIGNAPVLGRWFRFGDHAYAGSTTTVMKAAHGAGEGVHGTRFGANARLLMDLGGLDDNRVVLMGGQDGWLGSDRLVDQIPEWLAGRTVPLPLSAEAQAARAVRTLRLGPRGGAGAVR